ncbi:hypothetical protein SAMN04488245_102120 [Alloyangia pacifica]|uniref:Uncharacterized protein n=1 Tax=Alloyangia pacifica TaxID=311180 RepID=A0A1I6PB59_9RHOB|nr:hypothetical protein SAMN04488245_102120 [Alloyangia pacifica]SFS37401.1 hypothetical protein SAMN04488050_101421 [Alloyangia pacifica]
MSVRPKGNCGPTRGAMPRAHGRRRRGENTSDRANDRANDRAPKGAAYIVAQIGAQPPNVGGGQ